MVTERIEAMEKISWTAYTGVIGGAVILYYLVIGWLYYRRELRALIGRQPVEQAMTDEYPEQEAPWEQEQEQIPIAGAFDELEEVVYGLGRIIRQHAGAVIEGPALLVLLRTHLAGYDGLHREAFRAAINRFVIREAEEQCAISYTEAELDNTWDAL